jgi:hypothetical protein
MRYNRYILPQMDTATMEARVKAFVETDWRGMASGIWWARLRNETTEGIVSEISRAQIC